MRRREFVLFLGGAATAWPLVAPAQEPGKGYRLGGLNAAPRDAPHWIALFQQLRQSGYVEGQNLEVDRQGYGLSVEQFAKHAAELADARVDVILAGGDAAVRAPKMRPRRSPFLH